MIKKSENEAKAEAAKAEGIAQKKRIEAQGIADSVLLQAKAQAQANRLLSESLTDKVIRIQTKNVFKRNIFHNICFVISSYIKT